MEREYVRQLMWQVMVFIQDRKLSELDSLIEKLNPEKDSLRVFTGVMRSSFIVRHELANWPIKVDEFYEYHHHKNTENLSSYFINLR